MAGALDRNLNYDSIVLGPSETLPLNAILSLISKYLGAETSLNSYGNCSPRLANSMAARDMSPCQICEFIPSSNFKSLYLRFHLMS